MHGNYYISISGEKVVDELAFFDKLDKYAEQRYGTYRNYWVTSVEDMTIYYDWVARFIFNNDYKSR